MHSIKNYTRRYKMIARRRGRPPSYDRVAAMRAIGETFRLRGFAATSLDDIAAATGMNRPSLFAAFGNKKAMYLAALENARQEMSENTGRALQQSGNLAESLEAFFDEVIGIYCAGEDARGCIVFCTAPTAASVDDDIREVLAQTINQIETQLKDRILRADVGAQYCIRFDASTLAKLLSATLISIAVQARCGIPEKELRGFARTTLAAALGFEAS